MVRRYDEYEPVEWGVLSDKRFNKEIDLSDVRNKEDYQNKLKEFLYLTPDKEGHRIGLNIINAKRKSFDQITTEIWNNSKILEEHRKQQLVNQAIVKEVELTQKGFSIPRHRLTKAQQNRALKSKKPNSYFITRYDQVLVNKGTVKITFHKVWGYKQYRDAKTGKYTKIS